MLQVRRVSRDSRRFACIIARSDLIPCAKIDFSLSAEASEKLRYSYWHRRNLAMYVLHQDRMTVAIFEILPTLQSHLLLPAAKLYNVFIDEVDHSIDDVEIDYRHESARLRSFKNWPVSYIRPETLAAAGFYFTGQGDTVKCFDCHTELCQWLKGDDPIMDHERLSPTCKYVNDTRSNVSTQESDNQRHSMALPGLDVCGIHDDAFGVFMSQMEKAKHIYYSSYANRLASFDSWDRRKRQTKEQLAQAGFFYTKNEDHTFCFYCGVDIYDWQPHEDPWEMHCYWMPECHYLLRIKGFDYPDKFSRAFRYRTNQAVSIIFVFTLVSL